MIRFLPFPLLFLAACSSISTNFDYDENADFSRLKTYQWLEGPPQPGFELSYRRGRDAVDVGLAAGGYGIVTSDPDFLVAIHFGVQDRINVNDWGYGYGRHGHYVGGRSVDVYQYQEGTMVIDVVDAADNELLWRGSATKTLSSSSTTEERAATMKEAVTKLLAGFPPGG